MQLYVSWKAFHMVPHEILLLINNMLEKIADRITFNKAVLKSFEKKRFQNSRHLENRQGDNPGNEVDELVETSGV